MPALKLTPEIQAKIVDAIKLGNYRITASKYAGIGNRTMSGWIKRGQTEDSGIYRDFYQALIEAENFAEVNAVMSIVGSKDLKALQWFLERRYPERWARDSYFTKQLAERVKELEKLILGQQDPAIPGQ